jgi:integrase/recombinase XerD
MKTPSDLTFNKNYEAHLKHLALKGHQPKTVSAYSRAIRRIGEYFDYQIHDLTDDQLLDYFSSLLKRRSWTTVKLDLYGLKFFYRYVLKKPWIKVDLIKPPKATRLPDILTIEEASTLFNATHKLSYRVLFFTLYSLGLRLGEGLSLEVGDIDTVRKRVHIRDGKGNKDRFVPLPSATVDVLRRFWQIHRHPVLLFPNRKGGLKASCHATTPLDRGGVQVTMRQVVAACGLKKRLPHTAYATAMPLI